MKGSVLVETVFCILPFTLILFLCLELLRAGYLHVLVAQSAFIYTRDRALGLSEGESQREVFDFLKNAMGRDNGERMRQLLDFESEAHGRTVEGKVHIRYPLFFRFEMENQDPTYWRHHLEITKKCQFPG